MDHGTLKSLVSNIYYANHKSHAIFVGHLIVTII